ncbi:hypothetical protein C8Q75DRAFT_787248 [Abortiporus biennis]|nr:hypothetical protein C8Q75DRAFT_787248 [Abortiporus biennis]
MPLNSLANASLPTELWINIISFMDREDLISTTLVSQRFLCVAQQRLFSRVVIRISYTAKDIEDTSFECKQQDSLDRIKFLSTTDRISNAVKHIVVTDEAAGPALVPLDTIFKIIVLFVNLMSFTGYGLLISYDYVQILRSLPHLMSLVLKSCSITTTSNYKQQSSAVEFPSFCGALRSLKLRASPYTSHRPSNFGWWASFLSPSTTKTLGLSTDPDSDYLLHLLSLSQSPSMTSLYSLTLTEFTSTVAQFIAALTYCPSLRRLSVSSYDQSVDILEDKISQTPNAAPFLDFAAVPYCLLRPLARYRRLRHIEMSRYPRFISVEKTHSLFEALCEGSRSTVQRFIVSSETITTETMTLFFTKFPHLRNGSICVIRDNLQSVNNVLSFLLTAEFPSSLRHFRVVDKRRQIEEKDLAQSYPHIVARLERVCPELRTLVIRTRTIYVDWNTGGYSHSIIRQPDSELDDSDSF